MPKKTHVLSIRSGATIIALLCILSGILALLTIPHAGLGASMFIGLGVIASLFAVYGFVKRR
jgi:hypothetical protein